MTIRRAVILATVSLGASAAFASQAQALDYPIDCAILLCMAGGWPGQGDCIPARAEFIRRITPFPVEPPLQLWRCPMNAQPASTGSTQQPTDDTTRKLLDAIKVWHVERYYKHRNRDGDCIKTVSIKLGSYDSAGNFNWSRVSEYQTPRWMIPAPNACSGSMRGVGLEWHDHAGSPSNQLVRY